MKTQICVSNNVNEVYLIINNIVDLDEYFEMKKKSKIIRSVFYALPIYENNSEK